VVAMLFGAMFLNPDGINTQLVGLAIAFAGWIVGFVWLRRIAGPDPDKEPSFWRYRRVDRVRPLSKVTRLPTPGWIATRLAMVVTVGVLVFVLLAPALFEASGSAAAYAPWLWLAAIGLASAGTFWIFRIARANPEGDTRSWRYRDF
jgi:hypothetical protein